MEESWWRHLWEQIGIYVILYAKHDFNEVQRELLYFDAR